VTWGSAYSGKPGVTERRWDVDSGLPIGMSYVNLKNESLRNSITTCRSEGVRPCAVVTKARLVSTY
jgi:hypothetical protein